MTLLSVVHMRKGYYCIVSSIHSFNCLLLPYTRVHLTRPLGPTRDMRASIFHDLEYAVVLHLWSAAHTMPPMPRSLRSDRSLPLNHLLCQYAVLKSTTHCATLCGVDTKGATGRVPPPIKYRTGTTQRPTTLPIEYRK